MFDCHNFDKIVTVALITSYNFRIKYLILIPFVFIKKMREIIDIPSVVKQTPVDKNPLRIKENLRKNH